MELRLAALGAAIVVTTTIVVVVKAANAPTPLWPKRATATERRAMAHAVAAEEPEWRAKAEEAFPSDNWSQRDDFHAREASRIRELARERNIPYEDVLRAIDDDIHAASGSSPPKRAVAPGSSPPKTAVAPGDATDPRGARAVPCKPRPFYD